MKRYRVEGMSDKDFFEKVSTAYELEYDGNTKEFIKKRWENEKARINEFLDETIERLDGFLKAANKNDESNSKKPKMK